MSALSVRDPVSLFFGPITSNLFLRRSTHYNIEHLPVVSVIAADRYFANGFQELVVDIMRTSGKKLTAPLHVVYRRGMVCIIAQPAEGVISCWRMLPARISLEQARCVLLALLQAPALLPTQPPLKEGADIPTAFTWREKRVLLLLREGYSQTEAAIILGISVKTVNAYKQSALRKLGLENNRQLQYWLLENLSE